MVIDYLKLWPQELMIKKSWFVVVFMPTPKEAMHDVLMSEPGYKFHEEYGNQGNGDIK